MDLTGAVDDVVALLREKAAAKNLTLKSSIPPNSPPIEADRGRLIQILTNLADNGRRHHR